MNKKNTITQTIRKSLTEFPEDPYDINCGQCEDFAIHVIDQLGGEGGDLYMVWLDDIEHYSNFSHAVIRWDSGDGFIYFDSECPEGTDNLDRLPLVANTGRLRKEVLAERSQ